MALRVLSTEDLERVAKAVGSRLFSATREEVRESETERDRERECVGTFFTYFCKIHKCMHTHTHKHTGRWR